jgi:hypothetical protein
VPTCGQATTSGELSATDWRRSRHLPQKPISQPKTAADLQQILSVWLYQSHGQRSRPPGRSAPFSHRARAASDRQDGGVYRGRDIVRPLDKRKCNNDRALVVRRQDEFDAQQQCRWVAFKHQLNRLAGQGLVLFVEQPAAAGLLCCAELCALPVGLPGGILSKGPRTASDVSIKRVTLGLSLGQRLMLLNGVVPVYAIAI